MIYHYDTPVRSTYAVTDDHGTLIPISAVGWYGLGHGDVLDLNKLVNDADQ